jgi:hypothetical protein
MIGLGLYVVNLEASGRKQQEAARSSDVERCSHNKRKVLFLLFCRLCLIGIIGIYRKVGFATNLCIYILTLLFLFLFPRLRLTGRYRVG